jgi:hypothetical protein
VCQITNLSVTVYRAEYTTISVSHGSFNTTQPSQSTQIRGHTHTLSGIRTSGPAAQNSAPLSAQRTALVDKFLLWFHYSYGRSSVSSPPLFGRRRVPGVVNGIFLSASGRGWGLASCGPLPPGGLGNPPEVENSRNYSKMYFFLTRTCNASL